MYKDDTILALQSITLANDKHAEMLHSLLFSNFVDRYF